MSLHRVKKIFILIGTDTVKSLGYLPILDLQVFVSLELDILISGDSITRLGLDIVGG